MRIFVYDRRMIAWAKSAILASGVATHSLVAHSADTGAVMARLLAIPTISRRLARLAGSNELSTPMRARLSVLAAIHDLGKANRGFHGLVLDGGPGHLRAGHIKPVVALMHQGNVLSRDQAPAAHRLLVDATGLDRMFAWTGGYRNFGPLFDAVLAHHGRLPGQEQIRDELWLGTRDGYAPATELDRIGAALESWFPEAFALTSSTLPDTPRFLHAFAGLVMLADWIASDIRHFPFDPTPDPGRFRQARTMADQAITRLRLDPTEDRQHVGEARIRSAAIIGTDREPRPVQKAIVQAGLPGDAGSLVVIEAETGSGKTEAALIHYANLFAAGAVDGLYFALPTRAAASQIHRRISVIAARMFGERAPPVILAVPGYIRVDDVDGARLPDHGVQWPDDMADLRRDAAWAAEHPKRFLAAPIAIGTIDQLMLGALNVRHAHLRSSPMLRQLLVIDEVHASDTYMECVLRHLLIQHRAAGANALLMSATLGTAARRRLMGEDRRTLRRMPPIETLIEQPYPAIHATGIAVPAISLDAGRKKIVEVALIGNDGNRALAERAFAAALAGARVLMIRNRVADACEVAAMVEELCLAAGRADLVFRCNGVATVHHGRFAPADRRALDAALECALAPGGSAPVICITTQTAEQSLDIDADILITDICPADVLLQRIGRLHRHAGMCRAPSFRDARVVVIAPGEDQLAGSLAADGSVRGGLLGLGKVYENLVGIVATRRTLAKLDRLHVPRDNRLLVEQATHLPYLDTLAAELGPPWLAHLRNVIGTDLSQAQQARLNLLDFTKPIGPPVDLEARIMTRLGADSRHVVFDQPQPGPFGAPIPALAIPGWMATRLPIDARVETAKTSTDGFFFTLAGQRFEYGRWGLTISND